MKRLLAASAVLLTAAFLCVCGCSQRKLPAVGPSNLLTIVTNLNPEDPAVQGLQAVFTRPVLSVEEESRYSFEVHRPDALAKQRDARNLVLMADLSKHDPASVKVREVLGKKRFAELLGRAGWAVLPNVEALGQTMVVVAGPDSTAILGLLGAEADNLYARADSMVTQRTGDILYLNGDDRSMGVYLDSRYGWTVRIPKGFKAAEDRKNRVVKLVSTDTQQPARLFLAYWAPTNLASPDPAYCLRLRARLAWLYYDEDRVDTASTTVSEVTFQGRKAVRIEGIWQNEKHLIGGPFFTFCFVEKGRFYLLDGIVFAPGMDKSPWLHQLEAMMLTFRDSRKLGTGGRAEGAG